MFFPGANAIYVIDLSKSLKKFIDEYDFNYKVDSESELDKLKKKVLDSEEFFKSNDNSLIKDFLNKNRYNKLFKGLEKCCILLERLNDNVLLSSNMFCFNICISNKFYVAFART